MLWPKGKIVATIGFFDGVHAGHRFLIEQVVAVARERGLPSAVITFPIHPRKVLQQDFQPRLLNSFDEKLSLLAATTEIDFCFLLDFTPALAALSADAFIQQVLLVEFNVNTLIIGYDHRFGKDRTEGFEDYRQSGHACGMEVLQARVFPESDRHVSSTSIRNFLYRGEVCIANRLLGYYYQLDGQVISGNKLGRTIGFPTANIALSEKYKVIPRDGIYAVWVKIGEERYKGMAYIGTRPSVTPAGEQRIEVNVLDFSGDLYGCDIRIEFVKYLRDDMKFETLEDLKRQLEQDKMQALIRLDE
jgi:riboflavin kinase/FMN adenylyltransferase